jgi:hypothetical protein
LPVCGYIQINFPQNKKQFLIKVFSGLIYGFRAELLTRKIFFCPVFKANFDNYWDKSGVGQSAICCLKFHPVEFNFPVKDFIAGELSILGNIFKGDFII